MYQVHLCGTFADLKVATKAVYSALRHPKESFSSLESKQDCPYGQKWPYRAAVYLRAGAESGEVFTVKIRSSPTSPTSPAMPAAQFVDHSATSSSSSFTTPRIAMAAIERQSFRARSDLRKLLGSAQRAYYFAIEWLRKIM
jgi:hypothetical protein